MINKLIDEPYWNELGPLLDKLLGNFLKIKLFRRDYEFSGNKFVLIEFLSERGGRTYSAKDISEIKSYSTRMYWSKNQILNYCNKNMPLLRGHLIESIREPLSQLLEIFKEDADSLFHPFYFDFPQELKTINNLNDIFLIVKKADRLIISQDHRLSYEDYQNNLDITQLRKSLLHD